ncbi:GNAT family N-acetyltransferase [Celerinatantimonas sp. YJH-8]|uniref:GNAT family N-acetyltransferase n=1 Tax=Celerinatantimonas sp. YJH-8 TaxID=3228714 RepID=UPI0038C18E0F
MDSIREINEHDPLDEAAQLLHSLRQQYTFQELLEKIREQQLVHGYQLVGSYNDQNELVGIAGFIEGHSLAWGHYLLIEDLVVSDDRQGNGVGEKLLSWLRRLAYSRGCRELHVNSGLQRFFAHKLFLQEGFRISSHHFSLKLLPDMAAD